MGSEPSASAPSGAWRYTLLGGSVSVPITRGTRPEPHDFGRGQLPALSYWRTGSKLSLTPVLLSGVIAGYAAIRRTGGRADVGVRAGGVRRARARTLCGPRSSRRPDRRVGGNPGSGRPVGRRVGVKAVLWAPKYRTSYRVLSPRTADSYPRCRRLAVRSDTDGCSQLPVIVDPVRAMTGDSVQPST